MQLDPPPLMTPQEVAAALGISERTMRRWAETGRLGCIRTVGGHRRYFRQQVELLVQVAQQQDTSAGLQPPLWLLVGGVGAQGR
jgi:excisionase family DNA binding protein